LWELRTGVEGVVGNADRSGVRCGNCGQEWRAGCELRTAVEEVVGNADRSRGRCGNCRQEWRALWELRTKLYHKQNISENVDRSITGLEVTVVTYN
jgi:hypothetical protein